MRAEMKSTVYEMKSTVYSCVVLLLLSIANLAAASTDLRLVEAVKVKKADAKAVAALLNQHVDVNAREPDGATALHWAAYQDDLDVAALLIRSGATVDAANDYGVTPLLLACTNGNAAMIEALLSAGADVNLSRPAGETPLMTAAHTGRVDAVKVLLAHSADVNARESTHGQTALMWALSERHIEVARLLLEQGADPHARSASGFTPLLFAAREGDVDAARLFLARGADVNQAAKDGSSVLLVATVRGHVDLAKFLLDRGANPNAADTGYTALHWAAGTWESLMTRDYPAESGEWSVLGGLRPTDKLVLVTALLAHGADPNARVRRPPPRFGESLFNEKNIVGGTPFYLAALTGDINVMRLLVASGADPSLANNDDQTPLMVAAGMASVFGESIVPEHVYLEAVKLALQLGNDVNAASKNGSTALHSAAHWGWDTVVQFLVDNGADVNAKNKAGETPTKIADGGTYMGMFHRPSTAALLRKLGGVAK